MLAKIMHFAFVLLLALVAGPAHAARTVDSAPGSPEWIAIVIAILVVAVIIFGTFRPSKRGHQD